MGLHDALVADFVWTYRWFNAYNNRQGRAHLFRVPLVKRRYIFIGSYDLDYYSTAELEERLEQERGHERWSFTGFFREGVEGQPFTRQCGRQQAALEWESPLGWDRIFDWDTRPARGYCETCWNVMTNTSRSVIMPVPADRQSSGASPWYPGDNFKDWIKRASGYAQDEPRGQFAL